MRLDTPAVSAEPATGLSVEGESRQLVSRSALFLFARVGGAAAAFATQIWLAHWLGAEGQGRYVEAFAWLLLLSDVAVMGLSSSAMRFLTGALAAKDDALVRGFANHGLGFILIFGLALSASALGLAGALGWSVDASLVPWIVIGVPLLASVRFSGGVALSWEWFTTAAIPASLMRPLLFAIFVGLGMHFQWPLEPSAVLGIHVALMGVVLLGLQAVIQTRMRSRLSRAKSRSELRGWLRTGSRVLAVTLYAGYFAELNLLLYGAHHSSADLAILNAALRLAFLVQFGLVAVDKATLPGLSAKHARGDSAALGRILLRANVIKFSGALCGLLTLAFAGEQLLGLFPPEYAAANELLVVLAFGHVVAALLGPAGKLLSLTGHESTSFRWSAAALASAVAIYIGIGAQLTLLQAAWVVTSISVALSLILWLRARSLLGIDLSLVGSLASRP